MWHILSRPLNDFVPADKMNIIIIRTVSAPSSVVKWEKHPSKMGSKGLFHLETGGVFLFREAHLTLCSW